MLEGKFNAKVADAELGHNKKDQPEIRLQFEIIGGTSNGSKVPYSGLFTEKAVRYTRRDLLALGWKGKTITTAVADILAAQKTVPIEVVIATWKNPDTGKERSWSTVRSIGFVADPLKPLDDRSAKDVDGWLAEAADGGGDPVPF